MCKILEQTSFTLKQARKMPNTLNADGMWDPKRNHPICREVANYWRKVRKAQNQGLNAVLTLQTTI